MDKTNEQTQAVPPLKSTDKWESARVADYNAGWNACCNAMLAAAPQAQPVAEVHDSSTWSQYVAGVIGCYLGLDDDKDSAKLAGIAGIIERRRWAQPAQPVEAEQASAVALAPLPKGWVFNHAQQKKDEDGPVDGIWEIGFLDPEDGRFSPIVTVDTDLYYQGQDAEPLATAILARLTDAAAQPVREPMSEADMPVHHTGDANG